MLEDIITELDLNVVLIANAGLGTINSVVTTCEYLKNRNITVCGIIMNNYKDEIMEEDNVRMVEDITEIPVIAKVYKNDENLSPLVDDKVLISYFK